ncbi:hypothetical protein FAJ36_00410 [Streptococcus suis]|uniref:Uncharacterized protein n=1 Tax=Streptococcus suis TaxID=1307 RepID=A0A4V4RYD9_STRSU|nr:hypothetical protein [Streptococcus suis]MBY4633687.1 hypothetical protein [Streptococcus suis]TII07175.1 hypothetical protein FAJ36_00410 [Streptococcus suis]
MARRRVNTKVIDGETYYTTAYFVDETGMKDRQARKFLEGFTGLEGHTNPQLYEKKIMDRAIEACMNETRRAELQALHIELLKKKEQELAGKEEDAYLESLQNMHNYQIDNLDEIYQTKSFAEKKFNQELPIMMLRQLIYALGYEFNEELYRQDFMFHEVSETLRDIGEVRSEEHIKTCERLRSSNSYLKSRE